MTNLFLSLVKKNVLKVGFLFVALVSMSTTGWGQQVIGSFPYMDGGFENQTAGTLATAVSQTNWTRQSQSGASSSIVTTAPRSGGKYATVTSVATASRNLQSPQGTTGGPAASTSYVVQFYVKNAASVNGFQGGVTTNGTSNPTYSTAATLIANATWAKRTFILSTGATAVSTNGLAIAGRATAGSFDVDDVVIYAGTSVDATAANAPGTLTVNNPTTTSLDVSWGAASGGVDGGGYVVVRYSSNPNTDNDPNQNGIYAVTNTTTNGTGSLTGTIRYVGTGTSFTDNVGLAEGTQYWYKVYTVDKAFNYSDESQGNGTTNSSVVTYNVTYNNNGGTGTMTDPSSPYTSGSNVSILANSFTRTGYTFSGWNTAANGSGTAYAALGTITGIAANTVLYAQWTINEYTVSYDANTGTGTLTDPNSPYDYNTTVTVLANTFTKTGYTFTGWNTAANGSGTPYAEAATFSATANVTLYAQWLQDNLYSVTYNSNGGTGTMTDPSSPYTSGSNVSILANAFTRTGYTFSGWNTAANGSGTAYVAEGTITGIGANTVLYAQWTINEYTVSYNANGGSGTLTDPNSPYDYNTTVTVLSNTFTRTNYSFSGWNTAANGSGTAYAEAATFSATADVTLYAQWTLITYTVTYNSNGGFGTLTDPNSPYGSGTTVTVLANTFGRTGHTFSGWNTATDGSGTSYEINETFEIAANVILYAQWSINSYTVTYDGNGSTGGDVPVDPGSPYVYNTTVTVLGNTGGLVKTNYIFIGWNTAADGSGTAYAPAATFNISADRILYAQWQPPSLLQWNTFGNAGTETTEPSVFNDANVAAANLTQGSITAAGNANRFGGSAWSTGTITNAVSGNDYIQFVVDPNDGYTFTPTSFVFSWQSSGSGPTNVTLRSSADGYTADLGTTAVTASIASYTLPISGLSTISATTTFRLYGFGASAGSGTGGFDVASSVVNVDLKGTTALIPVTYTVTYNNNGGTGTITDPGSPYTSGSNVSILSNAFTRTGYTFSGWNTAANGSGTAYAALGTITGIAANTVLYAQWTINEYTVSYDANSGTGTLTDPNSPYDYNTTVTVLANTFTKIGYTFTGWNTAANGSGTAYAAAATFSATANVTLYAQWLQDNLYTVTYNSNGGTGTMTDPSSPYTSGSNVSILANAFTRTGYTFSGWNTAANGSGTAYAAEGTITGIGANTVLYAQWTINEYTVSYNANGGSGTLTDPNSPYDYNTTVTVLSNTFTRTNYSFSGWNTAANGSGTSYAEAATFSATADVTLYAQWTLITYTVTYNSNGGFGTLTDPNSPYGSGTTVTVLANTFGRTGHSFSGWNTATDGSGTSYEVNETFEIAANVILYAQWSINSYTVIYDGNGNTGGDVPVDPGSPYVYNTTVTVLGNTGTLVKSGGYTFNGWNTAADGSGTAYAPAATFNISADRILYAQWQTPSILRWNTFGNAGTETTEPSVFNDANVAAANLTLGSVSPSANTNRFGGSAWSTGTIATAVSGNDYIQFVVDPNDGYTFTPTSFVFSWQSSGTGPTSVTLRSSADGYTANLGTTAVTSSIAIYTLPISGLSAIAATTTFRLYGYGASAAGGTGGLDVASSVVNVDLKGTTGLVTYTVSYNNNGGTGTMTDPGSPYTSGSNVSILANAFTRTGYTFTGWNTAANGSGTAYAAAGTITGIAANTILYAQWCGSNTFTGTNGDFSDNANWSCGVAPASNSGTGVVIPTGSGVVTIDTDYDVEDGVFEYNGSTAGDTLIVAPGVVIKASNGGTIDFNGHPVVIKSDATGTGSLGSVGTLAGATNVTTERYVRQNTNRGWRILGVPVTGSATINETWQEGATAYAEDPNPGYGTKITVKDGISLGCFDANTFSNSLLYYDVATASFKGHTTSTCATPVSRGTTGDAWMLYVRGNRTGDTTGSIQATSSTVLRVKGELYGNTGGTAYPIITVDPSQTYGRLVGNVAASPIDFTKIAKTGGIQNSFRLWDPLLNDGYNLGGYVLFSASTTPRFEPDRTNGSYTIPDSTIQSGTGFFVKAIGSSGTVQITENSKVDDPNVGGTGFRPLAPAATPLALRANLYSRVNGVDYLASVTRTYIADGYNSAVDINDDGYQAPSGVGLAIKKGASLLSLEQRNYMTSGESINYSIFAPNAITYKLEFVPYNLSGIGATAILEDKKLGTITPLDLNNTSFITFTATPSDATTYAERFRVIFTTPTPVNITNVTAQTKNAAMQIDWKVAVENGVKHYEVERSQNGTTFTKVGTVAATINNGGGTTYNFTDVAPAPGLNYYRIKTVDLSGATKYSYVVRVNYGTAVSGISLTTNVIANGKLSLEFANEAKGRYGVRLTNNLGQQLMNKSIEHMGGTTTQTISLPSEATKGIYHLELVRPNGAKQVEKLIIN